MNQSIMSKLSLLVVLASLGACDGPLSPDTLRTGGIQCPRWQCGYNTTEVNGKSLQELNLNGIPNGNGVMLVNFIAPLGPSGYQLGVDGDELVARRPLSPTLRGVRLIGSVLVLEVDGSLTIPVTIAAYEGVESWADGNPVVPAYALVYNDVNDASLTRSVCKGTLIDPLQASVVVLAGDRYDNATKTVQGNQTGWVTLACAGSAAAKMALLGYGPHGDVDGAGTPATVAQRQATLKMITADYCGDGHSYTEDGTPLHWENATGSVTPTEEVGTPEAIWTANGALCLDTPRVVEPGEVACALPSCDDFTLDDGEWMTHNPSMMD
jgi:hypothetical protein